MQRAILILSCLFLLVGSGASQRRRSSRKPKPKPDILNGGLVPIPKDEILFSDGDYLILPGWRLAVRNDKQPDGSQRLTYYDPYRTTSVPRSKIKQVWLRAELLKNDVLDSYWLDFDEIDCGESRLRIVETHEYNKTGDQIESATTNKPQWQRIIPDSLGEELFGIICLSDKDRQRTDMDNAASWFRLARQCEKKNDLVCARLWYKTALEEAPENPKILAGIERVKETNTTPP
jgi:hypothetical protein